MNIRKQQHEYVSRFPKTLTEIPVSEIPHDDHAPVRAWRSRYYLAQEFHEDGLIRLSVCRAKLGTGGRWQDGLSWDELQQIKHDVGYGDWYAYEIYPADINVVNVANMRHLWLFETALPFGWNAVRQHPAARPDEDARGG
jgi:hypothetical protein